MSSNNYSFEIRWSDSDRGYIATCPEFPDLSAFGETAKEAIEEAGVALSLFVDTYEDEGIPLPEPRTVVEFSGQLRLRMPKKLHARLSASAETEGVSLNQLIVTMLSEAVGTSDLLRHVEASLDYRIAELISQVGRLKPKHIGHGPSQVRLEDDTDEALARIRDRVVVSLLLSGEVEESTIREAMLRWRRGKQRDTLWRILAEHKDVDREVVYAEAARIYAFSSASVDPATLDTDFVKRVVESLTREQRDQLLGLRVLPLKYEIDPDRGSLRLIFATRDPMRPETLKLIHELHLEHFELRYAPESEIAPIIEELFPILASSDTAK